MPAGTCLKCGCTADRACIVGDTACAWIDAQEDLCSRCAQQLALGPIQPATLPDAALVIRSLRAALFETADRLEVIQDLVERVFSAAAVAKETNQIWTP